MKRQLAFAGWHEVMQFINYHVRAPRTRLVLVVPALLTLTLACQTAAPPDRAADEKILMDLDVEWSKAAAAKDLDKTVSYYSQDAIVLPGNAPIATTKEAIREVWKEMITNPGYAGGWKATRTEVARSGDLAYLSGTYELTMNDASGKPTTDRGKYLEVWKKQTDGTWKCVADIWNSDLAPPPPAEKKQPLPAAANSD